MLSRSSELVVVRAAGVSVWQFMLPALVVAFVLGISSSRFTIHIAAAARGEAERLYAKAFDRATSFSRPGTRALGCARMEPTALPSFMRCRSSNQGLELSGVTRVPIRSGSIPDGADRSAQGDSSRTAAGNSRTPGSARLAASPTQYKHYLVSTYLTPTQVRDSLGTEYSISFWDLPNFIEIAERAGLPATQYRVQYQLLLSRPFLLMTMVLIAATCSLRALPLRQCSTQRIGRNCCRFCVLHPCRSFAQLRHGGTDLCRGRGLGSGDHRGVPRAHRALVQRGRVMALPRSHRS